MTAAVSSGTCEWRGYQLAYEIWGDVRGVPFLFMHGLLLDSLMNRELARRFADEGYRVILLDFLGHGASDRPAEADEHRIAFLAEQALACLDALGIDQAVIGGCSLGANATLHVAAKAPERCLGLLVEMPVMERSTTFTGIALLPVATATRYFKWGVRPVLRAIGRLPRPRFEAAASALNAASAEPEVISAVLNGYLVGAVVPPRRERMNITAPTLIIAHGWDRMHKFYDSAKLASEIPGAELIRARTILELRTYPEKLWPEIRDRCRHLFGGGSRTLQMRRTHS